MELPKNIKQIGESDRNCKIYVEDYVVSYIKQMNQIAINKEMSVALYGLRKTEGTVTYLFIYGAAKLDFLQREVRHLSQAQCQEIEKLRRKYFQEQEFLGYCLLTGEMFEGIYVYEQEICRYVSGYAQFYEKNDSMLAYMLETRTEEVNPEVVDSEKYDVVRRRQEERRVEQSRGTAARQTLETRQASVTVMPSRSMRGMRVATVAVFGLLCLIGIASLGEGRSAEDLQVAARQAMSSLTEQKIPDAEDAIVQNVQKSTLIAEDKLMEALRQEGAEKPETTDVGDSASENQSADASDVAADQTSSSQVAPAADQASISQAVPATDSVPAPQAAPEITQQPISAPTSYTIKEGDTLIGIAMRNYGSEKKVSEICTLNDISDPDNIKIGQKILLP